MTVLAKGCRKNFFMFGKVAFFCTFAPFMWYGWKGLLESLSINAERRDAMRGLEVSGAAAWDRTLTGLLEDLPEMRRKLRGELMELAGKKMENKGTDPRSSFEAEAIRLAGRFVEKFAKNWRVRNDDPAYSHGRDPGSGGQSPA